MINLCLDSLNNETDVQYGEWKELMNIILHRNYYSAKYSKNKKVFVLSPLSSIFIQ